MAQVYRDGTAGGEWRVAHTVDGALSPGSRSCPSGLPPSREPHRSRAAMRPVAMVDRYVPGPWGRSRVAPFWSPAGTAASGSAWPSASGPPAPTSSSGSLRQAKTTGAVDPLARSPPTLTRVVCGVDVADPSSVDSARGETLEALGGRIDSCSPTPGTRGRYPFLDSTLEEWRRCDATNLDGVFFTLQAAARRMVARPRAARWWRCRPRRRCTARPATAPRQQPRPACSASSERWRWRWPGTRSGSTPSSRAGRSPTSPAGLRERVPGRHRAPDTRTAVGRAVGVRERRRSSWPTRPRVPHRRLARRRRRLHDLLIGHRPAAHRAGPRASSRRGT